MQSGRWLAKMAWSIRRRVQLLRLRAQLTERLYGDEPERLRRLRSRVQRLKRNAVGRSARASRSADLLRDSADKLLREMAKLKERRRNCSPGSGSVSAPQRWTKTCLPNKRRHGVAVVCLVARNESRRCRCSADRWWYANPADDARPGSVSGPTASLRTALDPATLDALLRSDGSGDAGAQAAALQRAEGELRSLVEQLQRRATQRTARRHPTQPKK